MSDRHDDKHSLRALHDRLGSMIDQVGQPDYSLRDLVSGLREVRDSMFALSSKEQIEDNLCAGHAESWFCGRNHLPAGFDHCVVCCYEEAWRRSARGAILEEAAKVCEAKADKPAEQTTEYVQFMLRAAAADIRALASADGGAKV